MNEIIPVTFCNKEGARLFGVFHRPHHMCKSRPTILLLSPGVKTRVAPHRLYIKMTERFLALGYPVLRFDFHGLGDSEGEVQEVLLADLYGSIQVGRYVDDTIAAMDWMQGAYGTSQFIVSGLCGGALTGLLTGARDSRIVCLLGLSIPVILDGSHIDFSKYMTDAQLKTMREGYLSKIWDIRAWYSWIRFLTFQSDYRLIVQSIAKPLLGKLKGKALFPPFPKESGDNTNPYFAPSFFRMVTSSRHVFLVFAEMDRLYWEFEKKFMERYSNEIQLYSSWYEIRLTKQANHIFSFREWEEDMLSQCCTWLRAVAGGSQKTARELEPVDEINRTIA